MLLYNFYHSKFLSNQIYAINIQLRGAGSNDRKTVQWMLSNGEKAKITYASINPRTN